MHNILFDLYFVLHCYVAKFFHVLFPCTNYERKKNYRDWERKEKILKKQNQGKTDVVYG